MEIRQTDFDNNFATTLNGGITSSDTVINLNDTPDNPTKGFLAIDADDGALIEYIYFESKGSGFVTCPSSEGRGQGGTSAVAHDDGAVVKMYVLREHLTPLVEKIEDSVSFKNIEYYTSDDTWTKPNGLKFITVEVVGGGAGGGGAAITSTSQSSFSGGGGAGGYSYKKIDVASLGATEIVTIGVAGSGGNGVTGDNATTTTFGSLCSATGGNGGVIRVATGFESTAIGGNGGVGVDGDINISGGSGGTGMNQSSWRGVSGSGGDSFYGGGAGGEANGASSGKAAGTNAGNYGGGGSGAFNSQSQTATTGGNGSDGIVIVKEYF